MKRKVVETANKGSFSISKVELRLLLPRLHWLRFAALKLMGVTLNETSGTGVSNGESHKVSASVESSSADKGSTQNGSSLESAKQNVVRMTAVGHACRLMSRSPLHKHMMTTDLEWLALPKIMLGQFRHW